MIPAISFALRGTDRTYSAERISGERKDIIPKIRIVTPMRVSGKISNLRIIYWVILFLLNYFEQIRLLILVYRLLTSMGCSITICKLKSAIIKPAVRRAGEPNWFAPGEFS